MRVAPRRQPEPAQAAEPIRQARYCYDHLAGSLGTGLLALLLRKGWLIGDSSDTAAKQLELTPKGIKAFTALGIDLEGTRARRRQFACRCLDWSERRDHLGGALGAALAEHLQSAHWIERRKHSRVVAVKALGHEQLGLWGLRLA